MRNDWLWGFCLYFIFDSKVFRLHAKLHYTAEAVRSPFGQGLGYCYLIRRRPKSFLLGRVTLPLIFVHVILSTIHLQLCGTLMWFVSISPDLVLTARHFIKNGRFFCWWYPGILILSSEEVKPHETSILDH